MVKALSWHGVYWFLDTGTIYSILYPDQLVFKRATSNNNKLINHNVHYNLILNTSISMYISILNNNNNCNNNDQHQPIPYKKHLMSAYVNITTTTTINSLPPYLNFYFKGKQQSQQQFNRKNDNESDNNNKTTRA